MVFGGRNESRGCGIVPARDVRIHAIFSSSRETDDDDVDHERVRNDDEHESPSTTIVRAEGHFSIARCIILLMFCNSASVDEWVRPRSNICVIGVLVNLECLIGFLSTADEG